MNVAIDTDGRGTLLADWNKRDAYLETRSGKRIYLLDPDRSEIDIDDIAHGLALSCRWSGQCDGYFSIAQHSIGVAVLSPPHLQLCALLHDAPEAFLTDIPTPAKRIMPEYQMLEDNLWQSLAKKYNLPSQLPNEIKWADRTMLMSERDILKPQTRGGWGDAYEQHPRDTYLVKQLLEKYPTWQEQKQCFLEMFKEYGGRD